MSVSLLRCLLPLVLLAGCSGPQDSTGVGNPGLTQTEQALYDDGDDSRKASDVVSALSSVPHLGLKDPSNLDTPDKAAAIGEFGSKLAVGPSTCLTTVRAANVVTFTFKDCAYLGYTRVNGTLEATYAAGPSAGTATITLDSKKPFTLETYDRKLDPIVIDLTLSGTVQLQITASSKQIGWSGTYSATGPGLSLTHTPAFKSTRSTVDAESCVTLDGESTTTINARSLSTTVTGYRRCGTSRACPDAGGKVTFTVPGTPRFLTIEFLGGRHTRVTLPDRSFETDRVLQCSG